MRLRSTPRVLGTWGRKLGLVLAATAITSWSCAAQEPITLRILAYNIHHGEGMDGLVNIKRIARLIESLAPDIVALQEVDSAVERTYCVDQASVLAGLTGMHSAFGAFFDYQGGRYGMALLSKYPFESVENLRLPDGAEPRTALAGRVRVGEPPTDIVIVGIHLYRTAEERYAQATLLMEHLAGESAPIILAGDFNSRPGSEVIAFLSQNWQIPEKGADRMTFPSGAPDREIDYIMFRPHGRFEVLDYRVIDESLASDHRPLLIELALLDGRDRD